MIRWGIIGAGHMAKVFAQSIKEVENVKLVAISSQNNRNLEVFGNDFKIENKLRFNKYEDICKSETVDAIYISTLNNTHFDLIKLVALNKKNILCEKPFCLNLREAIEIQKILAESKVKFFEAIAYLSHPQTSKIFNLINNDEIGEIKSIESSFGFKVKKIDPKSRLFDKKLGGGAILDIGCYPISFISLFAKKRNMLEFKDVYGEICHTNVDIDASANLLINNKIKCKIQVSLKKNFKNNSIIMGTKGKIMINFPWLPDKKVFLEIFNKDRYYKVFINSELSVYANQIKNVSEEFEKDENNEHKLFDISKSMENMKYLDYWMNNIN
jgi:predicted dehydrogenase